MDTLYFSDFMMDQGVWPCWFCANITPDEEGDWVKIDGGEEVFGCYPCLESQDLKHN